ncbi:MAG: hypothetical protein EPO51_17515 [Phenylobacterium sp.]|uniref:hypothetical protein n=1 Tax=Phenylobacterium sp. TaxID=1871053 RepID=UPI0011F99B26|nr:hypothetical protein [Phenylobacterium sp.]TAJ70335.1 MAG: hypothetical protein EPO51_17515 [Phenylobacterium sp.]
MRSVLVALALILTSPAAAADAPPPVRAPIREFPIATVEKLGRAMARQDVAAWVATDALRPQLADPAAAGLRGWIVEDTPTGQRVRFLRDIGRGLEAGYDIDVTPDPKTKVSEPADRTLSAEEKANFAAWTTATAAMKGRPVCRTGYNHIVLKDPERDGWLVWLLAPMPELGAIPIGGHYRFSVTADGKTVTALDALTASCMVMPKPDAKAGNAVAAFVTHVVSPTPLETHVFLQLQSRQALIVGAGDHAWLIVDGQIEDRGPLKDLGKAPRPR